MDIGEVEGEVKGSDDQIDELRGRRTPRRDERSTRQRRPEKQPWKSAAIGKAREARSIQRAGHLEDSEEEEATGMKKKKKRAWVCYSCGGSGHPANCARHLQTDLATHAADEEDNTDEESSEEGDVCGVEWDCEVNGAGDEDDDSLGMGWEPTERS